MTTENKVFLGNLSFQSSEADIKQWICSVVPESSLCGISIISRGNRSLGYGFVTFNSLAEANEVVTKLHGTSLQDRVLNVELTHNRPPPPKAPQATPLVQQPGKAKKKRRSRTKNQNNATTKASKAQQQAKDAKIHPPSRPSATKLASPSTPITPSKSSNPASGPPPQPTLARASQRPPPKSTGTPASLPRVQSKTMIFVTNLPFEITDEQFKDIFADKYVVVAANLVRKHNGRLKGFGFVEFAYEEDAQNAIRSLDGLELSGRAILIKPALITENTTHSNVQKQIFTVKATGLPKQMDENQFNQLFQGLSVSSAWILRNQDTDDSLQEGYLQTDTQDDATRAVQILNATASAIGAKMVGNVVETAPQATNMPPGPTQKNFRRRPKYRNWRGKILSGKPPPMAYKDFIYPLGPYYLPLEFENIVNRREEVLDVQVDQELGVTMKKLTKAEPKIMSGPIMGQKTYATIFHNLINTEETRMRVDIRQYDLTGVTMEYQRGLYVLKVPGLAEKRPSVLRGDIVKVKLHDADASNATIHDGYAHFVNLDNVHVAFHQDIHPFVARGFKFDVQFTFNRTPLRLCHRALNFTPAMWQKLFFSPRPVRPRLPISSFFGKVALNQEQNQAVVTILHNQEAPLILHGPPGTGKTSTVVEAILQIANRSSSSRILVCAPSNSAVDLVASLLMNNIGKASMLRLNGFMRAPKAVDPQSLLDYCYMSKGSFDIPPLNVLLDYNIILATCVSSGYLTSMGVPSTHFTHVFVDEAGEALEPETLIPIQLAGGNSSIVLAGDHLQLGPIVRSATALEWRYDRSLMEHLLDLYHDKLVCKLVRSYRAHPALMHLYNTLFYKGELINCADPKEATSLLKWKELPNKDIPLMFIHCDQEEARDADSPSWYNFAEKEMVMQIVQQLLDDSTLKLSPADIGIITPYRKQVQKINNLAHFLGAPYDGCKVGTVENFQGQERKVIILSLVRSRAVNLAHDSKFKLGFCDNPKRLNVALSRAKDLLVIIGNGTLFGSNDAHWASLLAHFKEHNLFKGAIPTWHYTPQQTPAPAEQSYPIDVNADQGWDEEK